MRSPHETFYYYKGRKLEAARSGKWKLRLDELYDLEKDPHECRNVIADPEYAERLAAMKEQLLQWFMETGDVVPRQTDQR